MKICSIAAAMPSLRVTNADLLCKAASINEDGPCDMVGDYYAQISRLLERSGAGVRYYRDRDKHETAYPLLRQAIQDSLDQAQLTYKDIDLLIYCGVGRGFIEPAMAYFVASDFGFNCQCFDILDACMSWVRALYLTYNLFASGEHSVALVVNAEFNIYEWGYPAILRIDSPQKWKYTFPAFTIGEASTATVLRKSDFKWNFNFRSVPAHVNLCTLPLSGYDDYAPVGGAGLAQSGINRFMCFGEELSRRAGKEMLRFIGEIYEDANRFHLWFPHLATGTPYIQAAKSLGISPKVYTATFPLYGNLVSASLPVALLTAIKEKDLARGNEIVLCPISAGMSLALVDFIY